MSDCIFCKIAEGSLPANKVYEDAHVVAFHDIAPKADTHVLVIPKAHIENLLAVDADHQELMGYMVTKIPEVARTLGLKGYRIVMNNGAESGQEVYHMHWHILSGGQLPGFK